MAKTYKRRNIHLEIVRDELKRYRQRYKKEFFNLPAKNRKIVRKQIKNIRHEVRLLEELYDPYISYDRKREIQKELRQGEFQ